MGSCIASAVGADSFNVYIAMTSIDNNNEAGNTIAIAKEDDAKCKYLIKYAKEDSKLRSNSTVNTPETNGQIEKDDADEPTDEADNNNDMSDSEKEANEIENLK